MKPLTGMRSLRKKALHLGVGGATRSEGDHFHSGI